LWNYTEKKRGRKKRKRVVLWVPTGKGQDENTNEEI